MVEAYMLIVVEHGAEQEVLQNLRKIEGIEEVSLVLGEYDIHCKLKADSVSEITEIVIKVRKLRILTSETLIALEESQRFRKLKNHKIRTLGHKRARH